MDVVFVHGLDGDPFITWQHCKDREDSWPYWLAKACPQVAVHTIGYEGNSTRWFGGHAMSLPDRAKDVCPGRVSQDDLLDWAN